MKIKNSIHLLVICISICMVGCATTLSDKQKQSLTTVSVATPQIAQDAYQEPNARQNPGTANAGGAAGGFIGSLVGSAIDASVMASQQKSFEKTNEQYFEIIKSAMPTDLESGLFYATEAALRQDALLGTRLVEKSPNRFINEVSEYGLSIQSQVGTSNVALAFVIKSKVTLLDAKNNKLFSEFMVLESSSAYTLADYAEVTSRLQKTYQECLDTYQRELSALLDRKFGRK